MGKHIYSLLKNLEMQRNRTKGKLTERQVPKEGITQKAQPASPPTGILPLQEGALLLLPWPQAPI